MKKCVRRNFTLVLSAAWCLTTQTRAQAQEFIVSRPPSFQAMTEPAFENDIVARINRTGQFQPQDLRNLAQLIYLESIAMHVDIRTDLAETTAGNFLNPAATRLTDASEAFYRLVADSPNTPENRMRARDWLESMEIAREQIESILGDVPGFSKPAADRLARLSRLMQMVSTRLGQLETNRLAIDPLPIDRTAQLESLRRQAQSLGDSIKAMSARIEQSNPQFDGAAQLGKTLTAFGARVKNFENVLTTGQPSDRQIEASFRSARESLWRVEATVFRLDRPPADLGGYWQVVRNRFNDIADAFGTPRVIDLGPLDRPVAAGTVKPGSEPSSVRIYRGTPPDSPR